MACHLQHQVISPHRCHLRRRARRQQLYHQQLLVFSHRRCPRFFPVLSLPLARANILRPLLPVSPAATPQQVQVRRLPPNLQRFQAECPHQPLAVRHQLIQVFPFGQLVRRRSRPLSPRNHQRLLRRLLNRQSFHQSAYGQLVSHRLSRLGGQVACRPPFLQLFQVACLPLCLALGPRSFPVRSLRRFPPGSPVINPLSTRLVIPRRNPHSCHPAYQARPQVFLKCHLGPQAFQAVPRCRQSNLVGE